MKSYWFLLLSLILFVDCKQDTATKFVEDINCYSDFSTVDWSALSNKYYHPNIADRDSVINEQIIDGFPSEIAIGIWCLLQNARADFHQKSQPLRAEATKDIVNTLDQTEAMFDTVFVHCVSQEYYMRLFSEMYNEVMPSAIDELIISIKHRGN